MSSARDPNRFAEGMEASSLRARIYIGEAELSATQRSYQQAEQDVHDAAARMRETEAIYEQHKHLLADARTFLDQVQQRRDAQLHAVAAQRAFLHPVRKMPVEILGHIFELCLEDSSAHVDRENNRNLVYVLLCQARARRRQPFLLAAVCRRWRAASLACPRAWSHLVLDLTVYVSEEKLWASIASMDLVISRSRSAPVTIWIFYDGSPTCRDKMLEMFLENMSRCISFNLYAADIRQQDILRSLLTTPAPQLVTALVHFWDREPEIPETIFPNSPLLQELHLTHSGELRLSKWRELESITLVYYVFDDARRDALFKLFRSNWELTVTLVHPVIRIQHPLSARFIARGVVSLELDIGEETQLEPLFANVRFPNLDDVTLTGPPSTGEQRLSMLGGVPSRVLTTLDLSCITTNQLPILLATLPQLPALVWLCISGTALSAADVRALCQLLGPPAEGAQWVCPCLTYLSSGVDQTCPAADILDLVKARVQAAKEDSRDPDTRPALLEEVEVCGWTSRSEHVEAVQNQIDDILGRPRRPDAGSI